MVVGRIASRLSRTVAAQCRSSLLLAGRQNQHHVPIISNQFHSLVNPQNKVVADQLFLFSNYVLNSSTLQKFGISSSASPEPNDGTSSAEENDKTSEDPAAEGSNKQVSGSISEPQTSKAESIKRRRKTSKAESTKREVDNSEGSNKQVSGSISEPQTSKAESIKRRRKTSKAESTKREVDNSEGSNKQVSGSISEPQTSKTESTKREVDNSNKFAIQSFAKNLLNFADNLGRASSVVKGMTNKQVAADTAGAVPLLKTLLEGVEMTDKQLAAVFKKFGVEKFDPTNEQFDPNRHYAKWRVNDRSKPNGTVADVDKPGYSLNEQIIRPAQVSVVENPSRYDENPNEGSK